MVRGPRGLHDVEIRHEHVRAGNGGGTSAAKNRRQRAWPRTAIATAAVQNLLGGGEVVKRSRKPEIMGDAAHAVLVRTSAECTGNFFIDDEVLKVRRSDRPSGYAVSPGTELMQDFFCLNKFRGRADPEAFCVDEPPALGRRSSTCLAAMLAKAAVNSGRPAGKPAGSTNQSENVPRAFSRCGRAAFRCE